MSKVNENREVAIKISGVKKMYKLGQIGGGTLQSDLQSWWARVRGKEDPNTKIGEDQRSNGKTFMALNGVDMTVYKGEALGIIGGNGAGKSTLLKLLSRVTAPTEGDIDLYGRVASMLEVGTGFNPEMTGRENVYLNGAILGMTKSEIDAKMEQIIEFSEVREFIDTPVKRYSSGMFVKLAFSVAAHLDSEIMIMDEVLAVGDMAFQKKCLDKMRDAAKQEGRTVLYVSHNMNTIRQLCDRCVVLDKGKVIFEGDVEDAIQVYLGKSNDVLQEKIFSKVDHENWYIPKIFITKAKIENNISNIKCGEPIHIIINLNSIQNASNLYMRLVILDKSSQIIGMAMSENKFSVENNSTFEVSFSFDTTNLAADKYMTRLSIFEMNEYGGHEYVCVINNFMTFSLQDVPKLNHGMNWEVNSWGHIAFPDFSIEVKK